MTVIEGEVTDIVTSIAGKKTYKQLKKSDTQTNTILTAYQKTIEQVDSIYSYSVTV